MRNHLVDIATFDLAGRSYDEVVAVPDADATQFVAGLERERILGLGVRALQAGRLALCDASTQQMIERHDTVMSQSLQIELMTLRVFRLLESRGIRHRLLKGGALAHSIASNPSDRSFRDLDVLIPGPSLDSAVDVLVGEGATRLQPALRPGFDRRFGKSVTLRLDEVEIDLHRLLAPGPFGVWMHPNDLFVLKDQVQIANRTIPTLDVTDHLLHGCYHVALGQPVPVLANLRDVVLLAAADVDWDRVDEVVKRWRGTAVMQRCVKLVMDRLNVSLPERLTAFRRAVVVANERVAINPYLTDDPAGRFSALAPATFKALPLGDRPAFAQAVGYPEGSDPIERTRELTKRLFWKG